MLGSARTLRDGFLRSVEKFPERAALEVEGRVISYREMHARAASIAATLASATPAPAAVSAAAVRAFAGAAGEAGSAPTAAVGVGGAATFDDPPLTAVYALRSETAFVGVIAALYRGHGYVPLNPQFPVERTRKMLERSAVRAVIVDRTAARQLEELLAGYSLPLTLIFPDLEDVAALAAQYPQHRVFGARDLLPASSLRFEPVSPDAIAYLLFTSGSTGIPKGVMVAQRNVLHFVDAMTERYGITETDKFSQTFDMTFDLSAFDMFVAWEKGACVCCPSPAQKSLPAQWINESKLTIWFSVPSTAALMNKLRMLPPNKYPHLRYSLFCGEALPIEITEKWQKAAPSSVLENLYGPTELTIACTLYRWDSATSPAECEMGVVPIGDPYPAMEVLVADENLREVPIGETGELLMTGPQLSLGYWRDAEKTAAAFVTPPGKSAIYYRTGDRVRRPQPGKPMTYLGRVDFQIKIQGYRVELGEIEALAREAAGVDVAIAVGWPLSPSGADGVVVFLGADQADLDAVMARLKERLPAYMVPSSIRTISAFPLNANGKVDRKALTKMLEEVK